MSLTITLNGEKLKNKNVTPKIHYIPAKISENCTSNVENYFNCYTDKSDGDEYLSNSFRGYPLKGAEFKMPTGYTGVVCQEKKKPLSEDTDRVFKAMYFFDSFTNWNYDKIPGKFDPLHKAMDWLAISDNLGEPIEFEEDEYKFWLENNKPKAE